MESFISEVRMDNLQEVEKRVTLIAKMFLLGNLETMDTGYI